MTTVTTSASYKTKITADLPDYGTFDVTFRLVSGFFNGAGEEVIAGKTYTMTLDAAGNDSGSFYIPTPDDTGATGANWFLTLPSGYEATVTIAYSATAQSVADLIAAGSTTTDPDVITALVAGKATKVTGATAGNFAGLIAGGDLSDSGYAAADFDAAGAAATAQAAAVQRANHTGTQLLATISDVTATGSSLATAASVDAARGVIGLAAIGLPSKKLIHAIYTFSNVLTGSGAGSYTGTAPGLLAQDLISGATPLSSVRRQVANDAPMVGRIGYNFTDWSRTISFSFVPIVISTNTEGVLRVFYGKLTTAAFGLDPNGNYVCVEINNNTAVALHVCKAGVISSSVISSNVSTATLTLVSSNGTVTLYRNGVSLATTTNGPIVASNGTIDFELSNGATAATYRAFVYSESEAF